MLNLNRSNFQAHPFHLVSPSPWPLYTSISLLSLTTCVVLSYNGFAYAEYNLMLSLTTWIISMYFWWRDVIAEGRKIGISAAQIITCAAVVTTTTLAVLLFFEVGLNNIPTFIEAFRWIDPKSLNVSWAFNFESLNLYWLFVYVLGICVSIRTCILLWYILDLKANSIQIVFIFMFIFVTPCFVAMNIMAYLNMIIYTFIIGFFTFSLLNDKDGMITCSNNFYVLIDCLVQKANYAIQGTIITDHITCIFIFIGLCRLILSTIIVKESVSWKDMSWMEILKYCLNKFKKWLQRLDIIILFVCLIIFVVSIMNILGIGIIRDLSSIYTCFVTSFASYNLIWFMLILFGYSITGKVDKEVLSLSPLMLIWLLSFSCFIIYFFIPYVTPYIFTCVNLIKSYITPYFYALESFVKQISNLVGEILVNIISTLREVIKKGIFIISKLLGGNRLFKYFVDLGKAYNSYKNWDRSSPFRKFNTDIFTAKKQPVKLINISEFWPVRYNIPLSFENTTTVTLKFSLANFVHWANSNNVSIFSQLANLSYSKLTFNIVCTDYESLKIIYNKDNNYFDFHYFYNNSQTNRDSISELGLYFPVNKYYGVPFNYLKYDTTPKPLLNCTFSSFLINNTTPKPLVNCTFSSFLINNNFNGIDNTNVYDERLEDVFPFNSVFKVFPNEHPLSLHPKYIGSDLFDKLTETECIYFLNYTDADKKKLLISIAKDLYNIFENAERLFLGRTSLPDHLKISELETDMYKHLPDKLHVIITLKNCIDENAVFKYDKVNLLIYAILLDFCTNGRDPYSFPLTNGFFDYRSIYLLRWMNLSGTNWMSMKGLNLDLKRKKMSSTVYLSHIYPLKEVINVNIHALIGKSIPQIPFINYDLLVNALSNKGLRLFSYFKNNVVCYRSIYTPEEFLQLNPYTLMGKSTPKKPFVNYVDNHHILLVDDINKKG